MATPSIEDKDKYEAPGAEYQVTLIDVGGKAWDHFGNALIAFSTVIMALQNLKIGPQWVWAIFDDVTTVLFTFELSVRICEKGYLFFVEKDRHWNFFDSLVVGISLGSMIITMKTSDDNSHHHAHHHHHHHGQEGGGGGAASKLKVLRVLRLLRLLRLLRVLKSIQQVTVLVDYFLWGILWGFIIIIAMTALVALGLTTLVAVSAGGKAWFQHHPIPTLPTIDW